MLQNGNGLCSNEVIVWWNILQSKLAFGQHAQPQAGNQAHANPILSWKKCNLVEYINDAFNHSKNGELWLREGKNKIPPPRDKNTFDCANRTGTSAGAGDRWMHPSPHTLYAIPRATPSPSRTSLPVLGSTFLPSPPARRSTSRSSPS